MKISLKNLMPEHFSASLPSEVWGQAVEFLPKQRVLVLGPSGRGKTSFVNFLYGLKASFSGELWMGDSSVSTWSDQAWAGFRQQSLAMVFQTLRLFHDLTGWENLRLYAGLKPGQVEAIEQWRAWAEKLGIATKLDRPAGQMSQGERQRLTIVRALTRPFAWLVMDEPFSHLDHHNAGLVWDLVDNELRSRQAGLIVTALEPLPEQFAFDRRFRL